MYFAFSVNDVPDESLMPTGWYPARIVRSELRDLKSGEGQRLVITYVVDSGPYAKRRIDIGFNVSHPNPQAVEISQRELAKVLRACGLSQINDTLELHDRPHQIHIGVEMYKDREQNRINDWKPLGPVGIQSVAPVPPAPAAQARKVASATFQAPPAPPASPASPRPAPTPPVAPFAASPRPAAAPAPGAEAGDPVLAFDDGIPF